MHSRTSPKRLITLSKPSFAAIERRATTPRCSHGIMESLTIVIRSLMLFGLQGVAVGEYRVSLRRTPPVETCEIFACPRLPHDLIRTLEDQVNSYLAFHDNNHLSQKQVSSALLKFGRRHQSAAGIRVTIQKIVSSTGNTNAPLARISYALERSHSPRSLSTAT